MVASSSISPQFTSSPMGRPGAQVAETRSGAHVVRVQPGMASNAVRHIGAVDKNWGETMG